MSTTDAQGKPQPHDQTSTVITVADSLQLHRGGQMLVDGLSFRLSPGVHWVKGDEQTGKTTLLRSLSGEWLPASGHITTLGVRSDTDPAAYRRLSVCTETEPLPDDQTPVSAWLAQQAAIYPGFRQDWFADWAEALDLARHLHKPFYMLSAGSRRKAFVCAALASGAPLTLLDQPFVALDQASVRDLCEILNELAALTDRAIVIADYEAPPEVALVQVIAL